MKSKHLSILVFSILLIGCTEKPVEKTARPAELLRGLKTAQAKIQYRGPAGTFDKTLDETRADKAISTFVSILEKFDSFEDNSKTRPGKANGYVTFFGDQQSIRIRFFTGVDILEVFIDDARYRYELNSDEAELIEQWFVEFG